MSFIEPKLWLVILIYILNILSGIQAKLHLPQDFENILYCFLVSVVIDKKSTVDLIVISL